MQISNIVSVPANGSLENVLADSEFTFLSAPSALSVAVVQAGTAGDIEARFTVGSRVISSRFFPKAKAALGIEPDNDVTITDVGQAGERLTLRLLNTTVGALNVEFMVSIQPI